jgi:hypothetical protein
VKFLAALALAVATLVGVIGLAELTQNRPDEARAGTSTVVTFDVSTNRYRGGEETAALALWSVCAATVPGETSSLVTMDAGGYSVTVTPAIGEHGRKRLVGCLEDGTLDRVSGHLVAMSTV